jgi:hypothetical protein
MAKNTGKNFENEIRKSLTGADCWWFRIQDTNDVSKYVKKAIAEKQPADFMAVFRSRPILIECKTWKWFHANAVELPRLKTPIRWKLNDLFEQHL